MSRLKFYGAPGTGKTTKLLDTLVAHIKAGVPLKRIAFISHSVAARDEARSRAKELLPDATPEDYRYFRTIHGICYGALHLNRDNVMQHGDYLRFADATGVPFSEGFTDELDEDGLPMGWIHSPGNKYLAVRQFAAAWQLDPFHPEVMRHWPEDVGYSELKWILAKYEYWKAKESKFDFVDMLCGYLSQACEPLDITTGIVDEAQDLSRLQWACADKILANATSIYYAGDDDQSIYGFIGADPLGFLHKQSDNEVILPRSYRVKDTLWHFAQRIIKTVKERKSKDDVSVEPGGHLRYWGMDPDYLPLDHGENIMIIARHHSQLLDIARDLQGRGIPCEHRGQSVTGGPRAQAVAAYLRAQAGEPLWLPSAAQILKSCGRKKEASQLRAEARMYPENLIHPDKLGLDFKQPWAQAMSKNRHEGFQNDVLDRVLQRYGVAAIQEQPTITLTTYHGSKGREANHVVLFTDVYQAAWDYAQKNPDEEMRLSYVGATRARQSLTIVSPTTDMYMRGLA